MDIASSMLQVIFYAIYTCVYTQVILEGVRGKGITGDIAIDDISLTPACTAFNGPMPAANTSQTTPGLCL